MISKELLMHFNVYNCLRLLMLKAPDKADLPVRMISFKASVQTLRQWESLLKAEMSALEQPRLLSLLCHSIAASVICPRPGRRESRSTKRWPKYYHRLTRPGMKCKRSFIAENFVMKGPNLAPFYTAPGIVMRSARRLKWNGRSYIFANYN